MTQWKVNAKMHVSSAAHARARALNKLESTHNTFAPRVMGRRKRSAIASKANLAPYAHKRARTADKENVSTKIGIQHQVCY